MDNFADDGIPISVAVIDIDWHYIAIDKTFGHHSKRTERRSARRNGRLERATAGTLRCFPITRRYCRNFTRAACIRPLNLHPAQGVRWYEDRYAAVAARGWASIPKRNSAFRFAIENERFVENVFQRPAPSAGGRRRSISWWIDWQQGEKSGLGGLNPLWALNHYHFSRQQIEERSRADPLAVCGHRLAPVPGRLQRGHPHGLGVFCATCRILLQRLPTQAIPGGATISAGHHRGERSERAVPEMAAVRRVQPDQPHS